MRALFVSGLGGDTRRYRCAHAQEQLALAGVESILREATDLQLYVDATVYDIFVLHRVPYSDLIADVIQIADSRGKPVIFETDDLIFRPDLYDRIGLFDTLGADDVHRMQRDLTAQRMTLQESDLALAATDFLAETIKSEGTQAFVHRNACSEEMMQVAELAHQIHIQTRSNGQDVVIGYFSGTGSHNRDFATVSPVLLEVMESYPDVRLHLSGQLDIDPAFNAYANRIRRAPFVSWRDLPHILAQVDINLAPLELDNPLCQAKSEIKFTEAALVGAPTIATPVGAYEYAIRHGENGMLAADSQAWRAALDSLITDPDLRHAMGESARQAVYQHYSPQSRSRELVTLLNQIYSEFDPAHMDLEGGPQVVAECMIRRLNDQVEMVEQKEAQLAQLRRTLSEWETNRKSDLLLNEWKRTERLYAEDLRQILARMERNA